MKYEMEMSTDRASVNRITDLIEHLYEIMRIQHEDSFKGIEGGASPYYKVNIEVKEEWI